MTVSQWLRALMLSGSRQLTTLLGSCTLLQAELGDPRPENRHMLVHILNYLLGTLGTCTHMCHSPVLSRLPQVQAPRKPQEPATSCKAGRA